MRRRTTYPLSVTKHLGFGHPAATAVTRCQMYGLICLQFVRLFRVLRASNATARFYISDLSPGSITAFQNGLAPQIKAADMLQLDGHVLEVVGTIARRGNGETTVACDGSNPRTGLSRRGRYARPRGRCRHLRTVGEQKLNATAAMGHGENGSVCGLLL